MLPGQRLFAVLAIFACLPLLSQCSKEPKGPKIRPLTPRETALWSSQTAGPRQPRPDLKFDQDLPPERLEALGDIFLRSKEYEGSLVNYLQVLQKDPTRADIRYKVAVILLLKGQYQGAREELDKVLALDPEMLEAHEAMALAYMGEKKYDLAIREFRYVLHRDRHRSQTRHLLGVAYLMANQPRKAIPELKEAVSLNPKNVSAYAALGQAYNRTKDYSKALAALKKGLALDPNHKRINYQIGMALAGLKRYDEAFAAFAKGADEAQAYNNIGVHYYMDGQYELAAKCFQKALELRPVFYKEAKNNLDKALEKLQESHKGSL